MTKTTTTMMIMMTMKMITTSVLRGKKTVIRPTCPCSSSEETEPESMSMGCQLSVTIAMRCYKVAPTRVHYKVAGMFVPQERTAWWQVHARGDRETMALYQRWCHAWSDSYAYRIYCFASLHINWKFPVDTRPVITCIATFYFSCISIVDVFIGLCCICYRVNCIF
jgi:hypothetical protein